MSYILSSMIPNTTNWRELYAQNRAAIAAAGVPLAAMTLSTPSQPLVPWPDDTDQHARALPEGRSSPTPLQHRAGVRVQARRGERADDRPLVHVPPGLDPAVPAPMVVMLHGCTQDPSTFAAATAMNDTADRHGFVVVYPGQPRGRNAQGCWNWFAPEHQQRGAGEPKLIAGIAHALLAQESTQRVDSRRIFVAGLSSGGAMALILAACYPDLFAAVAVHSGLPYRAADNVAAAYAAMGQATSTRAANGHAIHAAMGQHARPIRSLVIHGRADRTVAPQNSRHILAQVMHANHLAAPATEPHDPAKPTASQRARIAGGLAYTHERWIDAHGTLMHESIDVDGLGHAWSGGVAGGSYTDPRGPSASEIIWAFFAQATHSERSVAISLR